MDEQNDEHKAQKERLERYQQETQEQKAARVAQERATEQKAKEALDNLPNSLKTPFGIELFYDPDDTDTAEPEDYLTGAALDAARELMQRANDIVRDQITKYLNTPDFERIEAVFPDARQWTVDELDESPETALIVLTAVFYCLDYIPDYLKTNNLEPSLAIFASNKQQDDGTTTSTLEDFLKYLQTIDLATAAEVGKTAEQLEKTTRNVISHRPKTFGQPLDRISDKIFNSTNEAQNGLLTLDILTKPGAKNNPLVSYSIDFNTVESDVPFLERLTAFDLRVVVAYGALMDAGNNIFTLDQIFRAMGNKRPPTQKERKAINESLTKMSARTHIDNTKEIEAGFKYKRVKYDSDFLMFERLTGEDITINGKKIDTKTNALIHTFRYPIVLEMAADRKQLQIIPIEVLQTEINKSDFVLQIEDYLIRRISNMKRGYEKGRRILYATMYEKMNLDSNDRKPRQRLREYAQRDLDYYKKIKWISGYQAEKDGFTIIL